MVLLLERIWRNTWLDLHLLNDVLEHTMDIIVTQATFTTQSKTLLYYQNIVDMVYK